MALPQTTRSWLHDHPQLLAMIVRFNTQLAASIHPDRTAEWISRPIFDNLMNSSRDRRPLSRALSEWNRLSPDGYYDFRPVSRRFALLDFPVLKRLALYVGAALMRNSLARIIRRDDLKAIKAGLGDDAFDFAVRRAGFLALNDSYNTLPSTISAETAAQVGWRQLEHCLAGESAELTRRLQLKLPLEISLNFARSIDLSLKRNAAKVMRKILITEIQPDLTPCFT